MKINIYLKIVIAGIIMLIMPALAMAKIPNDPSVLQWAYEDVGLYKAWDYMTGTEDVVVAIIDNGFDTFHPDLRANLWRNKGEIRNNGIDDDINGYIDDVYGWNFIGEDQNGDGVIDIKEQKGNNNPRPKVYGLTEDERLEGIFNHGTVVAGIIGAVGNNGRDGAGINWNVKLMNLKVVNEKGAGDIGDVIDAIYYAVDNGADVINISIVSTIDYGFTEAVDYAYEHGVAVIAAAGNENLSLHQYPRYPVCGDKLSSVERVLGVSAMDKDHHITQFSNTGSKCIDITAPGEGIASTVRYSPKNNLADSFSGNWEGTSFAAPFVSGAAALIQSIQPKWGPDKIYDTLLSTVHHTEGQDETVYSHLFGAGLLQVDKAVELAISKSPSLQQSLLFIDIQSGNVIEKNIRTDKEVGYKRLGLVGIDGAKRFTTLDGNIRYAVVRKVDYTHREVKILSSKWHTIKKWDIIATGPLNVEVGDVQGDEELEIVVAPKYPSINVYRVYDMDGQEINKRNNTEKHNGVRIALVENVDGKDQIASLMKRNGKLVVQQFDKYNKVLSDIDITVFNEIGGFDSGDIDGDGEVEFVLGGGSNEGPFVAYVEQSGAWNRKFMAYGSHEFKRLDIEILNYNGGKKDEVIVHSQNSVQPIRVWDNKSKRLASWDIFNDKNIGKIIIISE